MCCNYTDNITSKVVFTVKVKMRPCEIFLDARTCVELPNVCVCVYDGMCGCVWVCISLVSIWPFLWILSHLTPTIHPRFYKLIPGMDQHWSLCYNISLALAPRACNFPRESYQSSLLTSDVYLHQTFTKVVYLHQNETCSAAFLDIWKHRLPIGRHFFIAW